jgi:hypothetical protein
MTKYDDEIREVESRLEREREALRVQAQDLTSTARRVVASPKGLLAAAVVGFLFGELTAPRRRRRSGHETRQQGVQPAAKALGIGGILGSAALTFARQRYGSPWVLANRAWHYYQMQKRTRQQDDYEHAPPARRAAAVRPAPVEPVAPATESGLRRDRDSGVLAMDRDRAPKTHAAS